MPSTLQNFRDRTLSIYKRDDKMAELDVAINETYYEMCAAVGPRKLEDQIYKTVVIKREDYPIPDNVLQIRHPIRLIEPGATNNSSQSYPMRFFQKNEYDEIEPNPNAPIIVPGRPWAYTFWKNAILLTQIPDKNYIIEANIIAEVVPLVSPLDQVIFSNTWDETLKAGALTRMFALIENDTRTAFWQKIYLNGYIGEDGGMKGGLKLLKRLNDDLTRSVVLTQPKYF